MRRLYPRAKGTEITVDSFATLVRAVVASSVSDTWETAVQEWIDTELEEDSDGEGVCVCGQTELVKLFTIRNTQNQSERYPIGSVCVNKFGVEDLNRQVSVFSDLLKLRNAQRAGERIMYTPDYFSRGILEYLYFRDAFTPDQWNGGDTESEYEFMLKMFNKRNKDDISAGQHRKISAILNLRLLPFIEADKNLK